MVRQSEEVKRQHVTLRSENRLDASDSKNVKSECSKPLAREKLKTSFSSTISRKLNCTVPCTVKLTLFSVINVAAPHPIQRAILLLTM